MYKDGDEVVQPSKTIQLGEYGSECVICVEDFIENQETIVLPCGHYYHKPCVSRWLWNKTTCPLCNYDIIARENITLV